MQDKVKAQFDQIQEQVNKQLDSAKVEGYRILKELGANVESEELNLSDVVSDLREANPTVKEFVRNLNVATYDNRFRANWNATMGTALAKLNVEKAYVRNVKPRIAEARDTVNARVRDIQERTQELTEKAQDKAQELRSKIAS
ncbi:hypothetical protein A9Q99_27565 [Gammaproteobacteria bacterium 45_16_T64]|nr:hypothetical protein A9Q99_27565 [Gammaproteobacteria bacterium 45_16_T64]